VTDGFSDQLVALLPRLRRFARGLCGSAADADDIVQAACERALARSDQWQPGTRLDSWMFRIAQTTWLDHLRHRAVRREDPSVDLEVIPAGDAVSSIEARLDLAAARRAVAKLPADQRTVLLLVCVEGLSYRETADVLQVPMGTVMSRLARARISVARMLSEPAAGTRQGIAQRGI
jgi:RNA polymerase sigma-70 factor (ECF subfamily)